ncbi:hypothetical protein ACQJBY_036307 [Aegilops geniculata]
MCRSRLDKKLSGCRWPCPPPAPSRSPRKPVSSRSIFTIAARNKDEDTRGVRDAVLGDGDGMGKVMRRYAGRQHLLR